MVSTFQQTEEISSNLLIALSQLDIVLDEPVDYYYNNQQPATSNQQPATSNQQPATSNLSKKFSVARNKRIRKSVCSCCKPTNNRSPSPQAKSSIRISIEKVGQLIDLAGEFVITQSMLAQSAIEAISEGNEQLQRGIYQFTRTREIYKKRSCRPHDAYFLCIQPLSTSSARTGRKVEQASRSKNHRRKYRIRPAVKCNFLLSKV